ncbi:MAG: hypothetical protein LW704_08470 [Cryomorphaceae bacterium]|nr:hypothetical protein [Cryomorphaceae bacterium]
MEADEFDRSFLALSPFASIITSVDPDHLDIYGDADYFKEGFQRYADLIHSDGFLVMKEGLPLKSKVRTITYAVGSETADISVEEMRFDHGFFVFDVRVGTDYWLGLQLGIPGIHNAENAAACIAMCLELGLDEGIIRESIKTFKGVKRRFEYHVRNEHVVYIDDYAHHPTEIHSFLSSVRLMYPDKHIVGAFQPHPSASTTVNLLVVLSTKLESKFDAMPPRKAEHLSSEASKKQLLTAQEALAYLSNQKDCVILTIGAGDIDRIVEPLTKALS